jgi:nucleoside-diphosphate-sugar epimerase
LNIIIVGSTSMIAKRLRSHLADLGPIRMAGRDADADMRFDLAADYTSDPGRGTTDVIIHCAAAFEGNAPTAAVRNELVNSVGALRVAQLAQDTRCQHLVYISSLWIYDHPQNGYFGSYGLSKRHGQDNLEWVCRETDIAFTALVTAQIYDEFGEARKHQPMFYRIMDAARRGGDVSIYGEADPERNLLFVGDFVEIVRRVVVRRVTGIHPVVHPQSNRLSAIAQIAFQVFGQGGQVVFQKDKPDIPDAYIPVAGDLFARIDYTPATGLAAGIELVKMHSR